MQVGVKRNSPNRHPLSFRRDFEKIDDITFQQIDGDVFDIGSETIIRLFGVTEEGSSVCARVKGFRQYFYVQISSNTKIDVDYFKNDLNRKVKIAKNITKNSVISCQLCYSKSLMNYRGDNDQPFMKIELCSPIFATIVRRIFESGGYGPLFDTITYDSHDFLLRFMIDRGVVGAGWVSAPVGTYQLIETSQRCSRCTVEFEIDYNDLRVYTITDKFNTVRPLRILSFDIECVAEKGTFPDPHKDPLIQIGCVIQEQGESEFPFKCIFVLDSCLPITGADVRCFEKEEDLLAAWRLFVIESDPDVITGYNINGFDLWYMLIRAEMLYVNNFADLGRIIGRLSVCKDTKFSSAQTGVRESKECLISGRLVIDMMLMIQKEHKLRSYTLNSVAAEFLGDCKEDVHHTTIIDLHRGDSNSRCRLATYCLKDAYLPLQLMEKLCVLFNYIEMARVTGVPFSYLLSRGQQIKVISQLARKSLERNFLIPDHVSKNDQEGFVGAFVIDPIKGLHKRPITVLDFSSLYPSIMIAHNLCYSTLINESEIHTFSPSIYEKTPNNDYFVQRDTRIGLLPEILSDLLGARKNVKAELKREKNPFKQMVLNGKQLALKISANSVYGFTGAMVGRLPCLAISSSVTSYGREMIHHTKKFVESRHNIKNNPSITRNAVVVYGDTDSVMIDFGINDLKTAMDLGNTYARDISKTFKPPIALEFEKVYWPYLLINKKRYAGVYYTTPEKYDKIDCKGIETVRRDSAPIVCSLLKRVLQKILLEQDEEGAIKIVHNTISDLLQNRLDMSVLIMSKGLSKEKYTANAPHVELSKKLRKRDPVSAPCIGDRVPFVITKGDKHAKMFEKAEDPIYALKHNIALDTDYYLNQQLKKPLLRIFEFRDDALQKLFTGPHMQKVTIPRIRSNTGIMKFIKTQKSCLSCNQILKNENNSICPICKINGKEGITLQQLLKKCQFHQKLFSQAWIQCQRCTKSSTQSVMCGSRDCPIFYLRQRASIDLEDSISIIKKFVY